MPYTLATNDKIFGPSSWTKNFAELCGLRGNAAPPQGKLPMKIPAGTLAWVDPEPVPEPEPEPRYILLPLEFQGRFTTAEKRAIDAAAETSDAIYEIKAAFRSAVEIDLRSMLTLEAMAGLVAAGIMTQERADKLLALIP